MYLGQINNDNCFLFNDRFSGKINLRKFLFYFFLLGTIERNETIKRNYYYHRISDISRRTYLLLLVLSYFDYELAENTCRRTQCDLLRRVIARALEIAHCARSTNLRDILSYYNQRAIYRMQSRNRYWKSHQTFAKLYLTSRRKI